MLHTAFRQSSVNLIKFYSQILTESAEWAKNETEHRAGLGEDTVTLKPAVSDCKKSGTGALAVRRKFFEFECDKASRQVATQIAQSC